MMSCSSATFLFSPKICLALIAIQTQNDHKRYVYSGWKMYRWWCKRLTMDKWRQTKKVVITKFIAFEFVCLFFVASLFWLWLNNMNDYEIRSIYLIYNCTQMCWLFFLLFFQKESIWMRQNRCHWRWREWRWRFFPWNKGTHCVSESAYIRV